VLASWYVCRLVDAMKLLAEGVTKRVKSAGFEVDSSYVYNRSKFFRGAEYNRRPKEAMMILANLSFPCYYLLAIEYG
jgi:hypothetical protein